MSWKIFAQQAPELAQFGVQRLNNRVAYLGTIRADGSPRVHPVTPILNTERLFLFMEPTSPKGKDLNRDGRYTLHCSVEDNSGGSGEFYVRGVATYTENPDIRSEAIEAAIYTPKDRYILFILDVDFAFMNLYENGEASVTRWKQ